MSLFIEWQSVAFGMETLVKVPVFNAGLHLVMRGDVIIDASWVLSTDDMPEKRVELADAIGRYLMSPDQQELHLKCLLRGSEYARSVWRQLLAIPKGRVLTYSELASRLASSPRAVARACRDNPYAGLIPCHRVVAKNGIGGFMGQRNGPFVELKQRILAFEVG